MTADELRRLAEIVFEFHEGAPSKDYWCLSGRTLWFRRKNSKDKGGCWDCTMDWQPHLRIEPALMVAAEFAAFYIGKDNEHYFCRLAVPDSKGIKYLPKSHSTNLPLA